MVKRNRNGRQSKLKYSIPISTGPRKECLCSSFRLGAILIEFGEADLSPDAARSDLVKAAS